MCAAVGVGAGTAVNENWMSRVGKGCGNGGRGPVAQRNPGGLTMEVFGDSESDRIGMH